ncbi:hypothetical protein T484DRAFT_1754960 [Baffinella frigidus]|nr:hypothetical protein T484DRAFT_1754960 [Cryptophyta sp. CCMP2293]
MEEMKRKISQLEDTELSEKRHAHPSTKTFVFNWRAEGWGPGYYTSESFDLGGGGVAGCVLKCGDAPEVFSHFIGFDIVGEHKTLRVHATMSVLDKEDRTLRQVYEIGTAAAPEEVSPEGNDVSYGIDFTPTKAEQDASVRPDGSVRLRAVVRVF